MKRSGGTKKEIGGFSFVELMVVIALVGILSAISIPFILRGLPEKRLKAAARNVYADLQKARLLAVKKNKKITVRFNESDRYYYFDEDEDGTTGFKEWNPDETRRDLADYGGVIYGKGRAVKNWNKTLIKNVVPYQDISFKVTGTVTPASVYLQYQNEDTITYAVTTTNYGTVKVRRFSGSSWE
ncbi:MAG: prepilin-type N-terminal cleavage/methylation domain-containing protein [Candidatus Electrothrix sp. AW2]|nr:prepilin-type N-terminal cleavage/methylation domain-containing protein [Candidatus Electrothrix gigas]MCI5225738.1 prepilin-type N-terminal cleavage/methylation domain-containing protein [Candidatus Electrothrix gigas]